MRLVDVDPIIDGLEKIKERCLSGGISEYIVSDIIDILLKAPEIKLDKLKEAADNGNK